MQTDEWLNTLGKVLWRSALVGYLFVLIWFLAFKLAGQAIYQQGAWFGLTEHQCNLIHYGGMGLTKILISVFFLFPYCAIRLVLRSRKKS